MITSQSMGMEMAIGRNPKAGHGRILEAHTSHVTPGRIEDVMADSKEACDFVEANGAVNARLLQLTYAGMASGLTVLTWEVETWGPRRASARRGTRMPGSPCRCGPWAPLRQPAGLGRALHRGSAVVLGPRIRGGISRPVTPTGWSPVLG